jgi:hypothetical protein
MLIGPHAIARNKANVVATRMDSATDPVVVQSWCDDATLN